MGRHKTISDEAILGIAREVFRAHGHTATTRQIADAAGVSEAVLYQRFGSKDDLFFSAMHPPQPDVDALLGPADPTGDAREYLRAVCVRIGRHFAEHIPLALRVMSHPSFDPASLARVRPGGPPSLRDGLAKRLEVFVRRGELRSNPVAAKLLISLAHDWALGSVMSQGRQTNPERALRELVDLVWVGLRPA